MTTETKSLTIKAELIGRLKLKADVKKCQRCGRDHPGLTFCALDNPVDDFCWWAMCPNKGQPILQKVIGEEALQCL